MKQKQSPSERDKSAYRKAPTRVVFAHELETGAIATIKNRLWRPLQTGMAAIYRKLQGYWQTHPHYYTRIGLSVLVSALVIVPIFGIIQQDAAVKAKVIRSIDMLTQTQVLTVATVASRSTVYDDDGLMHGFGYDVARQYASHLGIQMRMLSFDSRAQALDALHSGDVDLALLSVSEPQKIVDAVVSPLACSSEEMAIFRQAGIDEHLAFISTNGSDIAQDAGKYLCNDEFQEDLTYLAKFHNHNLLNNAYNAKHFADAIQKLPMYEYGFKVSAKEFDHDWQLLAMIGYQESHLDANATSPTGVQGIMMLTQDTARAMGVKNRTDAAQSIHGGAKYLGQLQEQFAHIPEVDRIWFVLAAYNMGPYAVKNIQETLKNSGKDPNLWLNFYAYLHKHEQQNSRYRQCITYVTNIRAYLEAIKQYNAKNAQDGEVIAKN